MRVLVNEYMYEIKQLQVKISKESKKAERKTKKKRWKSANEKKQNLRVEFSEEKHKRKKVELQIDQ